MLMDVVVLTPQQVIFEGKAKSVKLPGENGVFEILAFHKRLLSRLISGMLYIDEQSFAIKRGAVKINQNEVVIILE